MAKRLFPIVLLAVFLALPACANREAVSRRLESYTLKAGPIVLAIEDDLSGVACHPHNDNLLCIENGGCRIFEVTPQFEIVRVVQLMGFDDTEDLAVLPDGRVAVVEERRRNLVVFDLGPDQTSVAYETSRRWLIDPTPAKNLGLEGVAYDAANDRFFVVKEKSPRRLYEVGFPGGWDRAPVISHPWDIEANNLGMDDTSAVFFDAQTGHLLILSDESRCLVECTLEGKEVSRLILRSGSAGLKEDVPQPEGVALARDGTLYIVSEPNLLYVFRPTSRALGVQSPFRRKNAEK